MLLHVGIVIYFNNIQFKKYRILNNAYVWDNVTTSLIV